MKKGKLPNIMPVSMNCKREKIISTLRKFLQQDRIWAGKLATETCERFTLHLAIFREPYLSFIMEGKKKVETRFATRRCPPFEGVADGDVLLLKKAGGEIVGICEVEKVWFYHLDPNSLEFIKNRFGHLICPVDGSFWVDRESKSVATLMLIKNVVQVEGLRIEKRDRRGWVTIQSDRQKVLL